MDSINNLSDLWRTRRSNDPGEELSSILDGCRVIAQSVIPDSQVIFRGVRTAETDLKRIFVSPLFLEKDGIYPVPGDKVDVILGLTVHEVGHIMFSPEKEQLLKTIIHKANAVMSDAFWINKLMGVLEDIYVDHLMSAYPGYRDYLRRERDFTIGEFDSQSILTPLKSDTDCDRKDMLNALIYFSLIGGKIPPDISQGNLLRLGEIFNYVNLLCTNKIKREDAVLKVWDIFKKIPNKTDHTETTQKMQQEQDTAKQQKTEQQPSAGNKADDEPEDSEDKAVSSEAPEPTDESGDIESGEGNEPDKTESESDESDDETESEPSNEESGDNSEKDDDGSGEPDSEPKDEDTELPTGTVGEKPEEQEIPKPIEYKDQDLSAKLDNTVNDKTDLSMELAEEVEKVMSNDNKDLNQTISYLANKSRSAIESVIPDENVPEVVEIRSSTNDIEEKLRRILQDFRLKRTKDFRGMLSGRVSNRRLHRVGYNDFHVFQSRIRPDEIDMAVCLLMDLSGSVSRYRQLIEQVVVSLVDALTKEKVEVVALGYSSAVNSNIIRMYDKDLGKVHFGLQGPKTWGGTPSYQGLAAAEAELLKFARNKHKIIFHLTDGSPNGDGSSYIPELVKDMRDNKGFSVINIALSHNGKVNTTFQRFYGEDARAISSISELPDFIDKELRKELKI